MSAFISEHKGNKHGNWTILRFDRIDSHHDARWFCRCEKCGEIHSVKGFTLRNGQSTKCINCACKERRYK